MSRSRNLFQKIPFPKGGVLRREPSSVRSLWLPVPCGNVWQRMSIMGHNEARYATECLWYPSGVIISW